MSRRTSGTGSAGDGGDPVEVMVLGPTYCDLVFTGLDALPALGTERFSSGLLITAGGSAITAVALRRLGRTVGLVADVAADAHGDVVRSVLTREGVAGSWLRTRGVASTPVTAVLSTPADRAFVTHLPSAAAPADLAASLAASGARHLHVAGFAPALDRPGLVALAHAHGATVSFDPGWDERALSHPHVRRVARECDVLLPNRAEAARLADAHDADDAEPVLRTLAAARPTGTTVVKDGEHGAIGVGPKGRASVPSPAVEALDATGAGDVFDAGFLDAWLDGASIEACLRRGVACGARAVTAHGGIDAAPTRAELDAAPAEAAPRKEAS